MFDSSRKYFISASGLSPSHHIRHIVKILVNCRHNLTNHAPGHTTIQPVQLRLVLADRCMPYISQEFVFYFYLGMPIDIVDISLPVMSTHTGKGTVFMNVFPKCLHFEKNTLFHYFRIQWNPSRATPSRAATPLVRPYFQAPSYFSYISFKCQPLMNSHPTNLVRGQWFWFQPPLTSSHSAAARSGQPWNSWLIWLWAHRHTC